MSQFKLISIADALNKLEQDTATMVDIRDRQTYLKGHTPDAIHLTNETIGDFMSNVGFDQAVLVICYHGVSSQGAAEYLVNQGYDDVYSVEGGFAAWERANYPIEV
ncbi:thiosulfate sulfurtransferase GlpE [Vibrio sp. WJH972]